MPPPAAGNYRDSANQAHQALIDHAPNARSGISAVAKEMLTIGIAGTGATFGAGRNLGVEGGKAVVTTALGQRQESGLIFTPQAATRTFRQFDPRALGPSTTLKGIAGWGLGAVTGGLFNYLGQKAVAPAVSALAPSQFVPVPADVVVPPDLRASMNDLHPGWGDEVHADAKRKQADVATINSDQNKGLGRGCFALATAGRVAGQAVFASKHQPGLAGNLLIGTGVSVAAGLAIGAGIAYNKSHASVQVPTRTDVDRAIADRAAGNAVPTREDLARQGNSLPLFYVKQLTRTQALTATVGAPVRDPAPQGGQRRLVNGHDFANVALSVQNRAKELAKSTAFLDIATQIALPLAPAMDPATRGALAAGAICTAISPWFDALGDKIPSYDNKRREVRQLAVNAAAAQQEAQQAVPMPA